MTGCPLCDQSHDSCRFGGGSLGCVVVDCKNPHHRREWVGKTAADVVGRRLTLVKTGDETDA